METLTDCFSDSVPNLYTYIKHDCHVLRAISFFFIWHLLYKDRFVLSS